MQVKKCWRNFCGIIRLNLRESLFRRTLQKRNRRVNHDCAVHELNILENKVTGSIMGQGRRMDEIT